VYAVNATTYEQLADMFLEGPRSTTTLEKIRSNGDKLRYDSKTNEFGILSSAGVIKTYFIPDPLVHRLPTNYDYFIVESSK
jgi:pyocin large subunit-like protein